MKKLTRTRFSTTILICQSGFETLALNLPIKTQVKPGFTSLSGGKKLSANINKFWDILEERADGGEQKNEVFRESTLSFKLVHNVKAVRPKKSQ